MLKRIVLVSGFQLIVCLFCQLTFAQQPPPPDEQRRLDQENARKVEELQGKVREVIPADEVVPAGTATFLSPQHDIRMSLDFGFLSSEIAKFYGVAYGDTIDLNSIGCGRPRFLLEINVTPTIIQKGYLYSNGSFGTNLTFDPQGKGQMYGQCFGFGNPSVGAGANLAANVVNITNSDSILVSGFGYIKGLNLWPFTVFPFSFKIPFDGKPLSKIPIKLNDTPSTKLDFGTFQNNSWNSAGKERDLSLLVNAGGFSKSAPQADYLIADGEIGTSFPTKPFPTQAAASNDFSTDLPIWNPSTQKMGLSIGKTFFGNASPTSPGSGLFGFLLPIRVQGTVDKWILFFHIKKKYEVYLDGAEASFEPHNGSTGVRVSLTSSRWSIHNKGVEFVRSKPGPIKSVTASVLFDTFTLGDELLKFRVADFRLKIQTTWFVFPITMSSGQLQDSLNNGTIPIAGLKSKFSIDLPSCIKISSDMFWSAAGKCTDICPQRKGCLSFEQGNQSLVFTLDPTIQVQASGDFLHLALRVAAAP